MLQRLELGFCSKKCFEQENHSNQSSTKAWQSFFPPQKMCVDSIRTYETLDTGHLCPNPVQHPQEFSHSHHSWHLLNMRMIFDLSQIKKTMHKSFRKQLEQATSCIEFTVCIQLFSPVHAECTFYGRLLATSCTYCFEWPTMVYKGCSIKSLTL